MFIAAWVTANSYKNRTQQIAPLTQLTHGNNAFSLDWLDDLVYISYFCSRFRTISDIYKTHIFQTTKNYCGNIILVEPKRAQVPSWGPAKEGRGQEQISHKKCPPDKTTFCWPDLPTYYIYYTKNHTLELSWTPAIVAITQFAGESQPSRFSV